MRYFITSGTLLCMLCLSLFVFLSGCDLIGSEDSAGIATANSQVGTISGPSNICGLGFGVQYTYSGSPDIDHWTIKRIGPGNIAFTGLSGSSDNPTEVEGVAYGLVYLRAYKVGGGFIAKAIDVDPNC